MQFFSRYKDLFGVPDGVSVPRSRLELNNQLFIEKPYIPAYKQSYNLNNKLRDLKKDYNQLETTIKDIEILQHRRSSSRAKSNKSNLDKSRLNDFQNSPIIKKQKYNRNLQRSLEVQRLQQNSYPHPRQQKLINYYQQNSLAAVNQRNIQTNKKNQSNGIFKIFQKDDRQNDLLKHSQMNHIFEDKMKKNQHLKIKQSIIHRAPEKMGWKVESQNVQTFHQKPTNDSPYLKKIRSNHNENILSHQPNHRQGQRTKGRSNQNQAMKRRQQARSRLDQRRQKLDRLIKYNS